MATDRTFYQLFFLHLGLLKCASISRAELHLRREGFQDAHHRFPSRVADRLDIASTRLLDQVQRAALEFNHLAAMVDCSRQYVLFHGKRHLRDLTRADVGRFREGVARGSSKPLRSNEVTWS